MVRNFFGSPGGPSASPSMKASRKERLEQAKQAAADEKSRRRNFGFLNTGDKRMSNKSISRTREHAKQLAEAYNDPNNTSMFPQQPQPPIMMGFQDDAPFDPFGTLATTKSTTTKASHLQHATAPFVAQFPEPESTASTAEVDSYETASVGSAYDMDFLPNTTLSRNQYSTPKQVKVKKRSHRGPTLDQFVGESDYRNPHSGAGSASLEGKSRNGERSVISMPTLPSNSSMQANFARQSTSGSNNSGNSSTSGAAARRRMRSQMRSSSNSSVCSANSETSSYCSTPPESPAGSVRNTAPSRNRVAAYQHQRSGSSFYSQTSSVNSHSGNSGSDNLFSDGTGGFTFDAFGLDQSQVEREVDKAMQDLAGQGMPGFSMFLNADMEEDFAPDNWDSPNQSRQSSPTPMEEDGFVDGFRVTRQPDPSPATAAEKRSRSSSVSAASRRGVVSARASSQPPPRRWHGNNDEQQQQQQQQEDSMIFDEAVNPWKEDPWGSDPEDKDCTPEVGNESEFGGTKSDVVQPSFQTAHRYSDSQSDFGAEPNRFQQASESFSAEFRSNQTQFPHEDKHHYEDSQIPEAVAQDFAADFVAKFSPQHSHQGNSGFTHAEYGETRNYGSLQYSVGNSVQHQEHGFADYPSEGVSSTQEHVLEPKFGAFGAASASESQHSGPGAHGVASQEGKRHSFRDEHDISSRSNRVGTGHEEQDTYRNRSAARHHLNDQTDDVPTNYSQADYNPSRSNYLSPAHAKEAIPEPITKSKFASFRSKYENSREAGPPKSEQSWKSPQGLSDYGKKPMAASYRSPNFRTTKYDNAELQQGEGYHPQPHDDPTSPRDDADNGDISNDKGIDYSRNGGNVGAAPQSTYGSLRSSYAAATSKGSPGGADLDDLEAPPSEEHPEEKKEDDNAARKLETAGNMGSLKAKWRQWEAKATIEPSPQRSNHQRTSVNRSIKKESTVGEISNSLNVEILTPDIVEERRQEKRRIRTEELKKANQVPVQSPQSGLRKSPGKQGFADDERQPEKQQKSFASLRDRLKPTNALSSKSEPGSGSKSNLATAVVDRLKKESPSSLSTSNNINFGDAKSDAGATPSFLANVKLRKVDSPRRGEDTADTDTYDEHRSPMNTEINSFVQDRNTVQSGADARNSPEAKMPVRKLTYRERRELELKRQEEETSKLGSRDNKEPPKKDVAALIRRRIAANKQKTAEASQSEDIGQSPIPDIRGTLKPVSRDGAMPLSHEVDGSGENFAVQAALNVGSPLTSPRNHGSSHSKRFSSPTKSPITSPKSHGSAHSGRFSSLNDCPDDEAGDQMLHKALSPGSEMEYSVDENSNLTGVAQNAVSPRGNESFGSPMLLSPQKKLDDKSRLPNTVAAPQKPKATFRNESSQQSSAIDEKPTKATDIKNMLSNFLGAKKLGLASSLPAPIKEDDAQALLRSKNHVKSPDKDDEVRGPSPQPAPPPAVFNTGGRPALKDDPKYERYFRMLKVGMPMEVVKHAMQKDGNDPSVMDGDHNKPAGLPLKEDPKYAKYFKMLKLGVSMGQVKHSMQMDGLVPEVMDQDHNLPASACEKRSKKEPKERSTHRRARLHWTTHQKVQRNSLWAKLEQDNELDIDIDEEEFNELFQAELQPGLKKSPSKGLGANRKKGAAVRVIDAKRANNGGIILARVKMTHDEMADAVDRIDGEALSAEQIENIIEFLPTKEEREQLEKYMLEGDEDAADKFDGLCECEKFMVSMMTVKHAKRKVRALLFKLQFFSCLESIAEDARAIDSACEELRNSNRLRQLLGIVLQFGNRLNTAGNATKRKAGAFSLDSLLKLNQAKAFDKKTTFLHYIVLIVQRNNDLLLNFVDDLPTVPKADKIYWDQCLSDLEEVENQLENVRRISLHEARNKKLKVSQDTHRDDDSLADMDMTLEEEVEALRSTRTGLFTLSAIKQVSALRDQVEVTGRKFMRLLAYFGEDDKKIQPHVLFNIFSVFCRDFTKAKEEVFANVKKRMREERKKNRAHTPGAKNGKPPTGPDRHGNPMMRSSSLQPNLGKVLKDFQNSTLNGSGKQQQKQPPRSTQGQRVQEQSRDAGSDKRPEPHPYQVKQVAAKVTNSAHVTRKTPTDSANRYESGIDVPEEPVPQGMQESGRFEELAIPDSTDSKIQVTSAPPSATDLARDNIRQKARRKMQIVSGRTTPVVSNTSNTNSIHKNQPTTYEVRTPEPKSLYRSPEPSASIRQTPPSEVNKNTVSPQPGAAAPRSAPPKLSSRHMMRHKRRMEAQRQSAT